IAHGYYALRPQERNHYPDQEIKESATQVKAENLECRRTMAAKGQDCGNGKAHKRPKGRKQEQKVEDGHRFAPCQYLCLIKYIATLTESRARLLTTRLVMQSEIARHLSEEKRSEFN